MALIYLKKNEQFLYEQIEMQLLLELESLPPETKIPPRSVLVKRFGVTRTTVDRAIAQLISKGHLSAMRGSGTYVTRKGNDTTSNYIGIILPNITLNGYPEIIKGIEDQAAKFNLHITICTTDNVPQKQEEHVKRLIEANVKGIIIIPSIKSALESDWLIRLRDSKIPFVFCNRTAGDINAPSVLLNNFYGAYSATKHLINRGCKNICFLSYPLYTATRERLQGYLSCLLENKMYHSSKWVYFEEDFDNCELDEKGIEYLINNNPDMDAVLCIDDKIALNVIRYLLQNGYRVPENISVVGFDNSFLCSNPYRTITSVDFKYYEMGVSACKMVVDSQESNDAYKLIKDIQMSVPEVIVRESSR